MNPYEINNYIPQQRAIIEKHRDDTANGQLWKLLNGDGSEPVLFELDITYVGLNNNPDWSEADEWYVTIKNSRHIYSFEYKTGLGHRVGWNQNNHRRPGIQTRSQYATELRKAKIEGLKEGYTLHSLASDVHVKKPNLADILYCLLMDRTHGESFTDWVGNFGYDEDSIKAREIYFACQKQEDAFNKLFTSEQIEAIETILEDY